jgi:3-mercaptopyruvate sulfurtransferase SseA
MGFAKREIDPRFKVDPKRASQKDLEEAMELLAKKRDRADRVKKGELKGAGSTPWAELSEEQKTKFKRYATRRALRQKLLLAKATAQGLAVTDKEVDAELARQTKK